MPQNLLDLTPAGLEQTLHLKKGGQYWTRLIYGALYHQFVKQLSDLPGLREDVRKRLSEYEILWPQIVGEQQDRDDGTIKWLLEMVDGVRIETVLMRFGSRTTVCVSTECGCSMGCDFCATGRMGLIRPLMPGEIVGQVLVAGERLKTLGLELTNVVFMGMGEPFENYDNVMTAAEIITADIGMAVAPRHITISTVGLDDGILSMANARCGYQLAVSLHSARQEIRERLLPAACGCSLEKLLAACREYNRLTKRRVFFEYAVLPGINDSPEDLAALAAFVNSLDGHVNLLSWNPVSGGDYSAADRGHLLAVQDELTSLGVRVLIRESRGNNIAAACGQLWTMVKSN